jgi:hypothetical protein
MEMTFKELDEHFKTYSYLTVAQGRIRLCPVTRKNIRAFVQWTRDELRLGCKPNLTPFPVEESVISYNVVRRMRSFRPTQRRWRKRPSLRS